MDINKKAAVERLAAAHFAEEPFLREIFWFHVGEPETLVRLLEVNEASITTNVVVPVLLNRDAEMPFDLMIAEVSTEELAEIRKGEVRLPADWGSVDAAEPIRRGGA